ncbi:hypothetical protein HYPBUDRAFT_154337 [Hyphopichia burtonii NRRL Y-1933]|uniref:beta-glucosidase n=1 Tax=Hyphopichia burtonii NRRL Y-1933 TaxID=984485 RepID=A0A1E4RBG2_9ASCO|nr:hypothetical protein HYPBUDRAFT_154337 [Hyphopichia burtonii NRRL Y-1933]ODV64611.1 hypothetical protein HYPBUDRAFT_154337 [Hyphopichia burtonii NRRL Y-1933]
MSDIDVEKTLSQLKLLEKIGLLAGIDFWHTFPVERLDVPSLRFSDGPNGVRGTKFFNAVPSACFANGTALAATFNKELLFKAGSLMAEEAKHKSVHVILGPTTNMARGPNGGRGFESFSDDPYLAGICSASIINGIQDDDIAATIKHFVGNDLEDQRNSSDSIITDRALREIYLEPFRLAVKYSNPKAFMTGYNKVNGEHVSQSEKIIQKILREEWNWDGAVMSDWFGTYTTETAIKNGLDIEMPGPTKFRDQDLVSHMINTKELHINHINDRVRNVLKLVKATAKSGVKENGPEDDKNNTPKTSEFLRQLSGESIVLLKNNNNVLPLNPKESIAVIGPNAKSHAYCGGGSASITPYYNVSPYDGISSKLSSPPPYTVGAYAHKALPGLGPFINNSVTGKKGFNVKFFYDKEKKRQFDEVNVTQSCFFLGDYKHPDLKTNLFYLEITGDLEIEEDGEYEFGLAVVGTGVINVDGNLAVANIKDQKKGEFFFNNGTVEEKNKVKLSKGTHKVEVNFGSAPTYTLLNDDVVDFGGGGALNIGFAKVIDGKEEIDNAVKLAKSVDKVVLSIGLNQEWESEGYDRKDLDLPLLTNDLVAAVLEANPNTVVVNQSGTPVEFPWLSKANALVQAWFGGNEAGNAIADVLFGDINPSGKLSLSWPLKFTDNPTYLNFKTERGRVLYGEDIFIGYRYYEKLQRKVAFPFGYGLSYTKFEYSKLKVSVNESKDLLSVSVDVKNIGDITGSEVVQVYIGAQEPSIIRPVKELKGFEKVELKSNKLTTVKFDLSLKDSTSFWDEYQEQWSSEAGKYDVFVAKSSDDIELIERFDIKESKLWVGL